ncbi:hypothetical protein D3C73_1036490 [compost metagenome]
MLFPLNTGESVPEDSFNDFRSATSEGARKIVRVYTLLVTPSCAVTSITKVLFPAARLLMSKASPLVCGTPFTLMLAPAAAVGVNAALVTVLPTFKEYSV